MDVEIRTTAGVWILEVDDREFSDAGDGAVAAHVREEIQNGKPLRARPAPEGAQLTPPRGSPVVVFNPGHVVAVVEYIRRRPLGMGLGR
jgi:hypothetical protein